MGNLVVILIVAAGFVLGVRAMIKHSMGSGGGCCGGTSVPKAKKKKLAGQKVAQKIITIEGMHCENCKNTVEKHLNQIEGAAAKVDLKKKIAIVSMDRVIDDGELRKAVEKADFKVTDIRIV